MLRTSRPHRARRVILITIGSVVGVVALALGAVLTVGGIFVPATYLQPWATSYADQFPDPRVKVVSQALLAPSGHNMQPWTITLDESNPDVLYLYADPTRLSPAVDPLARQVMVSQGTFLEYLHVSAAELGYATAFDLFPDGDYDETDLEASMSALPVARITLAADAQAAAPDYASLFRSDTNRAPYADAALTADQLTELAAISETGATLQLLTDDADQTTFAAYGVEGTLIETEYAAATAESAAVFHSTEGDKNDARSGFAVEGQGTNGFMKYLLQGLITIIPSLNGDAAGAKNAIAMTQAAVDHTAAYGLVSTGGNTRTEQVQAGVLFAHFSLKARTLGLVMQPLSQVLQEYPTMAVPYKAIHEQYASGGETIQMLVRVGTPTIEYPTSMRRDAKALVHAP
ncbi:hypothetical protein [Cryobacterium sp. PH31-L1]|uniref:Acg family FMN-binding oxidoreductase n=1 Tax=Cryobacterium sp. PH31-L1 TaxID=3046199 RepID=UPI0024B8AA7F|nr:hypothetical protein [Cryobacterium sp. PH31-L1]MDJ0376420.1 hypothetical protein [Cryobacterium sp. PH31-L1]